MHLGEGLVLGALHTSVFWKYKDKSFFRGLHFQFWKEKEKYKFSFWSSFALVIMFMLSIHNTIGFIFATFE